MHASKSGSVLGGALLVAFAIALVLTGLLGWVNTESKISRRNLLQVKAQYAAESVAEYAVAQLNCTLDQKTTLVDSYFTPASNPPALANGNVLGTAETSVLAGVVGGPNGRAVNVSSQLNTLQSNAAAPSGRFLITGTSVRVGNLGAIRELNPTTLAEKIYDGDPLRDKKYVDVREVRILSSATVTDTATGETYTAYCEETLQVRETSAGRYAAFYNPVLEIAPGAEMTISGPVHSNRDIYVQSNAGLNFRGMVTTAGKIYHGRAPGSGQSVSNGFVRFDNKSGAAKDMQQSGVWIDSSRSDWGKKSDALWGGTVLTGSEGINPNMPATIPPYIPDDPSTTTVNERVNDAHALIEPAIPKSSASYPGDDSEGQKFVSQASVVLTVGNDGAVKAYKYSQSNTGNYVRQTANGIERVNRVQITIPPGVVVGGAAVADKFKDKRRGKMIDVVDIDVGVLKTYLEDSSKANSWKHGSTTFKPADEWNGVLYVESSDTTDGAVRLVNGSSIPHDPNLNGFIVATNVPLYIQGNYNSGNSVTGVTNPAPAAVVADAVTILSNAWSDANSDAGLGSRKATPTGVVAAMVTGIVPSKSSTYSGGLENLPRFLEDWAGVTMGYRGSLIVLYESMIATEPWGSSSVYSAPKRDWGFIDMISVINSRSYRRIGFRQLSQTEFQTALSQL